MEIGIIGLGRMGHALAQCLRDAQCVVRGVDLSPEARRRAADAGVETFSETSALAGTGLLIVSLPDAPAIEAALFGPGGLGDGDARPELVIDTSTITPEEGRAIAARLDALGVAYLDAPVSGGPAGARRGSLTVMCGGTAVARERAAAVLERIADQVIDCGETGAGQAVKLVNNALVAAHLAAARDAMALGAGLGLAPQRLVEALNSASGRSAVTEVNLPRWVLSDRFDSGFAAGLMRKDIALARRAASDAGVAVPLVDAVAAIWSGPDAPADDADFNRMVLPQEDAS